MKLTVVTNCNSTIVYENVLDIKYIKGLTGSQRILFYRADEGVIKRNWQYLEDVRSIVLTAR
jgi:hypothetical protein